MLSVLWASPECAGFLAKKNHGTHESWSQRFFALKGSYLFYFKSRTAVRRPAGVFPLEGAKVEGHVVSLPPGNKARASTHQLLISITLTAVNAYAAKHLHMVLSAPTPEAHAAWAAALFQATVPRAELVAALDGAALLQPLVARRAAAAAACFPTADATVVAGGAGAAAQGLGGAVAGLTTEARRRRSSAAALAELGCKPAGGAAAAGAGENLPAQQQQLPQQPRRDSRGPSPRA